MPTKAAVELQQAERSKRVLFEPFHDGLLQHGYSTIAMERGFVEPAYCLSMISIWEIDLLLFPIETP